MPRTPTPAPRALTALLVSQGALERTRLGAHAGRQVPLDQAKLALLLIACGYKVRLNGDTIDVFATAWVPALAARVGETVLGYLTKQCALVCPAGLMDANDDRFESMFMPLAS